MQKILIFATTDELLKQIHSVFAQQSCLLDCTKSQNRLEDLLSGQAYHLLIYVGSNSLTATTGFLRSIQEQRSYLKVMVLSPNNSLQTRLELLELADDFLGTPFNLVELRLKLLNLLHLHKLSDSELLDNSPWLLRDVSGDSSNPLYWRPQELRVLECLWKHKNMLVTHDTIVQQVWGYGDFLPLRKTLCVYIRRIRSKIDAQKIQILTFKNRGYKLLELDRADSEWFYP